MKTVIAFLTAIGLMAVSALAASVTVEWDHEQVAGDKYIVAVDGVDQAPTDKKFQTLNLAEGLRSLQVRTVTAAGIQSDASNVLAVTIPSAPSNLRIKITVTIEGVAKLDVKGRPGHFVSMETSDNLHRWDPFIMVKNETGEFSLLDEGAVGARMRFWRGLEIQAS